MAKSNARNRIREQIFECVNKKDHSRENIIDGFHRLVQFSCVPDSSFKKVRVGDILDEEKSVRWNREEVEKLRKEYEEEVKRLNQIKNKLWTELDGMAEDYISDETGMSKAKSKILWNFIWAHYHHTDIEEIMNHTDEYIDLMNDLLN